MAANMLGALANELRDLEIQLANHNIVNIFVQNKVTFHDVLSFSREDLDYLFKDFPFKVKKSLWNLIQAHQAQTSLGTTAGLYSESMSMTEMLDFENENTCKILDISVPDSNLTPSIDNIQHVQGALHEVQNTMATPPKRLCTSTNFDSPGAMMHVVPEPNSTNQQATMSTDSGDLGTFDPREFKLPVCIESVLQKVDSDGSDLDFDILVSVVRHTATILKLKLARRPAKEEKNAVCMFLMLKFPCLGKKKMFPDLVRKRINNSMRPPKPKTCKVSKGNGKDKTGEKGKEEDEKENFCPSKTTATPDSDEPDLQVIGVDHLMDEFSELFSATEDAAFLSEHDVAVGKECSELSTTCTPEKSPERNTAAAISEPNSTSDSESNSASQEISVPKSASDMSEISELDSTYTSEIYKLNSSLEEYPKFSSAAEKISELDSASVISNTNSASVTSKAALSNTNSASVTPKPVISNTNSASVTSEPVISNTNSASVISKPVISNTNSASVTSKPVISKPNSASVTSKPVIFNTNSASVISKPNSASVTSKPVISKSISASVTSKPNSASVTSKPVISKPNSASVTSKPVISKPNSASVTSKPNSASVTSKPVISKPNSASVTSKPVISKPNSASVTSKPNSASVTSKPVILNTNSASVISKPNSSVISKPKRSSVTSKPNSASVISKPNSTSVTSKPVIPNTNSESDEHSEPNSASQEVSEPNSDTEISEPDSAAEFSLADDKLFKVLQKQMEEKNKVTKTVAALLGDTFNYRMTLYQQFPPSTRSVEVQKLMPVYQKNWGEEMIKDLGRILNEDVETFPGKLVSKWQEMVAHIKSYTQRNDKETSQDDDLAALISISRELESKKGGAKQMLEIVQSNSAPDNVGKEQPFLLVMCPAGEVQQAWIMIDGRPFLKFEKAGQKLNFRYAVFCLVAVHFILHFSYARGADTAYRFLERRLLNYGKEPKTVKYKNFVSNVFGE